MPASLDSLFVQLELYEPGFGRDLQYSAHVQALVRGHNQILAWDASDLNYFYSQSHVSAFNQWVTALRLPAKVAAAVLRAPTTQNMWWMASLSQSERVERVRVAPTSVEVEYGDKHGRYRMHLTVPPLSAEAEAAARAWLAADPSQPLRALAAGRPTDVPALQQLNVIPPWDTLLVTLDSRRAGVLELGVKFLGRLLTLYPSTIWLWRGLQGGAALRAFVEARLAQRQSDFDLAAASLPAAVEAFWAAPPLPTLPALTTLAPDPGLGAHLPPAALWPTPEANQMFMSVLSKVYKTAPKKIQRLIHPRPRW